MINWNVLTRPLRTTGATLGIVGVLMLSGCSTADTLADAETSEVVTTSEESSSTDSSGSTDSSTTTEASSDYADGTYTAEGSYQTPSSVESVSVSMTLEDDVVTAVEVLGDASGGESAQYQSAFIGGIADEVVGKDVDELSVDRVAGSSLTSSGFNEALARILEEASA